MSDLIRPEELYQEMNSGQPPVVIDVRGKAAYAAGHIPGALHVPGDQMAARMAEIPQEQPVVTY